MEAGVVQSGGGKVRLFRPAEYPVDWDPRTDNRLPIWEALHQLIRALRQSGESDLGRLLVIGLASRLTVVPLIVIMLMAFATAETEAFKSFFSDPDKFFAATPFLFLFACVIAIGSCLVVLDSSRATTFTFPLIVAAFALLASQGATVRQLRWFAAVAAAVSLLAPNLELSLGGGMNWFPTLPAYLLARLFA